MAGADGFARRHRREPPSARAEELAVGFRDRAYELMDDHPIAAAHLVLAAATLAPTCAHEQDVADHFTYLVADFAQGLARVHRRARATAFQGSGGAIDGAR